MPPSWYFFKLPTDEPDYDIPSKDYVSQETHRKWLQEICLKHVEKYIMANEAEPLIEQVQELQSALSTDEFHCCLDGCDRSYIHHSARVKYVQYISKPPIN